MKKLCMALLRAETEGEIDVILAANGYMTDDPNVWQPFDDNENNLSTINNQASDPTRALVEKIINAVDAMLLAKCWERGIDPRSEKAPSSMGEAAECFFGVRHGRLDSIDPTVRTSLADNIHIVATGPKDQPNYVIVDRGEGQTPQQMPHTFLSLTKKNKWGIPFTQGINNSGGTAVLDFCGDRGYQLLVSRRHPACPVDQDDDSRDLWGFTLVRRLGPEKPKRPRSMYVYLAPNGQVPHFKAVALPMLPGSVEGSKRPAPYAQELSHGSCIKLYNYKWNARSIATTNAREELEKYLYTLCLPVRISETRDYPERKQLEDGTETKGTRFFQTTLSGLSTNIAGQRSKAQKNSRLEQGFDPASASITLSGIGTLPLTITVYRDKDGEWKQLDKKRIPHGIIITEGVA